MKFKFLALAIGMATLICPNLNAKNTKSAGKHAKALDVLSKDSETRTFYSASDNASITLAPVNFNTPEFTNGALIPLTFTQHIHAHGKGIKGKGDKFLLDKGIYLVLFTGTFQANNGPFFFDVVLRLGSSTVFTNIDSHDGVSNDTTFLFDATGITTFFKVIQVNKPTNLSVAARVLNQSNFFDQESITNPVTALTRSLTIIKLDS